MAGTLAVKGYRELLRALRTADTQTRRDVRATLRQAAELTQTDARQRLQAKDARSAAGYRIRVRQRGVAVEQSLRKTTGVHPEWGAYQMKHALVPALIDNEAETALRIELALDKIAGEFNTGL